MPLNIASRRVRLVTPTLPERRSALTVNRVTNDVVEATLVREFVAPPDPDPPDEEDPDVDPPPPDPPDDPGALPSSLVHDGVFRLPLGTLGTDYRNVKYGYNLNLSARNGKLWYLTGFLTKNIPLLASCTPPATYGTNSTISTSPIAAVADAPFNASGGAVTTQFSGIAQGYQCNGISAGEAEILLNYGIFYDTGTPTHRNGLLRLDPADNSVIGWYNNDTNFLHKRQSGWVVQVPSTWDLYADIQYLFGAGWTPVRQGPMIHGATLSGSTLVITDMLNHSTSPYPSWAGGDDYLSATPATIGGVNYVICMAIKGLQPNWYGNAYTDQTPGGTDPPATPVGVRDYYHVTSPGYHAAGYRSLLFFYTEAQLIAALAIGTATDRHYLPHAIVDVGFSMRSRVLPTVAEPWREYGGFTSGLAYDQSTGILYIGEMYQSNEGGTNHPIVHAYRFVPTP